MKLLTTMMVLALISGCSLLGTNRKACEGEDCDTPSLLDNTPTRNTWYCYADGEGWDCSRESRPAPVHRAES